MRLLYIDDFNTVLSNLLAGEAHIPVDDSIRFQQGLVLQREWGARRAGLVEYRPTLWRFAQFQHWPESANPRAILDHRVWRALAHSVDKQAINDAMYESKAIVSDAAVYPNTPNFEAVDGAISKYPFDPPRAAQLTRRFAA